MITMGLNISALKAQQKLDKTVQESSRVAERLSSGMRITHASDDAAGLAISSSLNSDIRVFNKGILNLNDGISSLQIAQGALTALSTLVIRQKELAEQAANGVNSYAQRKAMDTEANALVDEFNRIVSTTTFNGVNLLNSRGTLSLQTGYGSDGQLNISQNQDFARGVGNNTYAANTAVSLSAGSYEAMVLVDVNNDGKLDYVTSNNTTNNIVIGLGNGDGTFAANSSFATATEPQYITSGDFNHDGNIDLVATTFNSSTAKVHFGCGNGSFSAGTSLSITSSSQHVSVGDFNGDGWDDLSFAARLSGTADVFINNGGTFGAKISTAIAGVADMMELVAGDFNGDGKDDIATNNYDVGTVSILLSNNGQSFATASTLSATPNQGAIDTADLNHDGFLDLVLAGYGSSTMDIFLGNGNGTFQSRKSVTQVASGSESVELADMNGDGVIDIIQSLRPVGTNAVSVFVGNGDGTFQSAVTTNTGSTPITVAIGDLDGNGSEDIAVANRGATSVGIILQNVSYTGTEQRMSLFTRKDALNALTLTTNTLERISRELGRIGASMSRIDVATSVLTSAATNYQEASARITDANIAEESATYIKTQIASQIAASMNSQTTDSMKLVLSLLK